MTIFNDRLYFTALDSVGTRGVYSTNGTTIKKHTDSTSTNISALASIGSFLIFLAEDSSSYTRLFSLSADDVVRQLSNVAGGAADYFNYDTLNPAVLGNYLYMAGYTATGNTTLYRTNGTTLQRVISLGLGGGPDGTDGVNNFPVRVGNNILFMAYGFGGSGHINLYKTDGTSITQIEELVVGGESSLGYLGNFNGKFYFSAFSDALTDFGTPKKDFYVTDGSTLKVMYASNAAHPSYNITGFPDDAATISIYLVQDKVFITGLSANNQALFSYDQNVGLNEVIEPAGGQIDPYRLIYWNGKYYASGSYAGTNTNLYEVSESGAKRLFTDPSNNGVFSLKVMNGKLYFVADDGTGSTKLYQYDGSYISKMTNYNSSNIDFDSGGNCDSSDFHYFGNAIWVDMLVDPSNSCFTKLTRICAIDSSGDCVH